MTKTLRDDLLEGGIRGKFYQNKKMPEEIYCVKDLVTKKTGEFLTSTTVLERESYSAQGERNKERDSLYFDYSLIDHLDDHRAPRGFKPKK